MEKVTVRRYFADAETGKHYEAGDTFSGRPERVAELRLNGLLEPADQGGADPLAEYARRGGMYEFPGVDGGEPLRVRGRVAALAELAGR